MIGDRMWCQPCGGMREVVDQFIEDTGDSALVVREYSVTYLECEHKAEHTVREYPSPLQQAGAPRSASIRDERDG